MPKTSTKYPKRILGESVVYKIGLEAMRGKNPQDIARKHTVEYATVLGVLGRLRKLGVAIQRFRGKKNKSIYRSVAHRLIKIRKITLKTKLSVIPQETAKTA